METSVHTKIQRVMSQPVLRLEEHVMNLTFFNILAAIVLVLVIMVYFAKSKIVVTPTVNIIPASVSQVNYVQLNLAQFFKRIWKNQIVPIVIVELVTGEKNVNLICVMKF